MKAFDKKGCEADYWYWEAQRTQEEAAKSLHDFLNDEIEYEVDTPDIYWSVWTNYPASSILLEQEVDLVRKQRIVINPKDILVITPNKTRRAKLYYTKEKFLEDYNL